MSQQIVEGPRAVWHLRGSCWIPSEPSRLIEECTLHYQWASDRFFLTPGEMCITSAFLCQLHGPDREGDQTIPDVTKRRTVNRRTVNKTRPDVVKNEVTIDRVGTTPRLQHIKQRRIKWYFHLKRMPPKQPILRNYNTSWWSATPGQVKACSKMFQCATGLGEWLRG